MEKSHRISAAIAVATLAASCGGVNSQIKDTVPDPETAATLGAASEDSKAIKDKCMALLQDGGEVSFSTDEGIPGKFITKLKVAKEPRYGDTVKEVICEVEYRYDIGASHYDRKSCRHHYYEIDNESEQLKGARMSVTDKPDGRSNASLRTDTIDTRRRPVYVPKSVTAEIPKSREGCRVGAEEGSDSFDNFKGGEQKPYDPAKLTSCDGFHNTVDEFIREVEGEICEKLRQEKARGDREEVPPLCVDWQVRIKK